MESLVRIKNDNDDSLVKLAEKFFASIISQFGVSKRDVVLQSVQKTLASVLPLDSSNSIFSQIQDCASDNCKSFNDWKRDWDKDISPPDCVIDKSNRCENVDPSIVHERSKKAAYIVHAQEKFINWVASFLTIPEFLNVQEFFRFRKDDPRDKALYLAAQHDHNGALNPSHASSILGPLADQFDFQYRSISSFENLCDALNEAAKMGPVKILAIDAYGDPNKGLIFSKDKENKEKRLTVKSDLSCFEKVDPKGVIVLLGGSVAQNASSPTNLAQRIANVARRLVIAPTCSVSGDFITTNSVEPFSISHPGLPCI